MSSNTDSASALTIVVPGTDWRQWLEMYRETSQPMQSVARIFGSAPLLFEWSGGNSKAERQSAAAALAGFVNEQAEARSPTTLSLVGFSHGGNVAALATHSLGERRVDNLVTIATPVLAAYQPAGVGRHIHVYNPADALQRWGGESVSLPGKGSVGLAGRTFHSAINIAIPIMDGTARQRHGNLLYDRTIWARISEYLSEHHA